SLIKIWLKCKFGVNCITNDISKCLFPKFFQNESIEKIEKLIIFLFDITKDTTLGEYKLKRDSYIYEELIKILTDNVCLHPFSNNFFRHIENNLKKILLSMPSGDFYGLFFIKLEFISGYYKFEFYKFENEEEKNQFYQQKLAGINDLSEQKFFVQFNSEKFKNKNDIFSKVIPSIKKHFEIKELKNLQNKLEDIFFYSHVQGTYSSFFEKEDNLLNCDSLKTFIILFKTLLAYQIRCDIESSKKVLKRFSNENFLCFQKLVFYTIAVHFDKLEFLFWELLNNDNIRFDIAVIYFGDELKNLLQKIPSTCSEDQKELIIKKVNKDITLDSFKKLKRQSGVETVKQQIYKALSHIDSFNEVYLQLKEKNNTDYDLMPIITVNDFWSGVVENKSPESLENLINYSSETFIQLFKNFKTVKFWEGPNIEGLAEKIEELAFLQPEKFSNMEEKYFNEIPFLYINKIIQGFKKKIQETKSNNQIKNLLYQIINYIDQEKFWNNTLTLQTDDPFIAGYTRNSVIIEISSLIYEILKYELQNLDSIEKILNIFILKLPQNIRSEDNIIIHPFEPLSNAINSPIGHVLLSYLTAILKQKDLSLKEKQGKLSQLEYYLDHDFHDAFTLLGMYLPNLLKFDSDWMKTKILFCKSKCSDEFWGCFVTGYFYNQLLSEETFDAFKDHYLLLLDNHINFKNSHLHNLATHFAIAYLRGFTSIDILDVLKLRFKKQIDSFNNLIIDMITFFWKERESIVKNNNDQNRFINKIIAFWELIYNLIEKENSFENNKKILAQLSLLTFYFPKYVTLNAQYLKMLDRSADYIENGSRDGFVIPHFTEYISVLIDGNSQYIRDISKIIQCVSNTILNKSSFFISTDNQKYLQLIIKNIYLSNDDDAKRVADKICDSYFQKGYEFLVEIHQKFHR
ncbi:MAG: hypothetical protein PHN56_07110, partial [Candidatus Nanoarchaeia archaeon]|nr:hypothetical protein [Candidatus Nanoarchaeia archaeon]